MNGIVSKTKFGLWGLLLSSIGYQAMAQTTVSLPSIGDTYTQQGTPTTNYGTQTTVLIRIDSATTLTRGGYFEFDLSSLPAGTITSAKLRLFGSHDTGGTGTTIVAFGGTVNTAWSDTALTYNNSLTLTGVDFSGTPIASTAIAPPPSTTYEWNVTSYIAARRAAGATIATIGLGYTVADTYRSTFNSKEATSNKPALVVTVDTSTGSQPDWQMFGHDYNNTRTSPDTGISTSNVGALSVAWRNTGGGITATPTIVGGTAYVSDFRGFVKAIRVSDGVTLWQVQPSTAVTMLSPSPFVTTDTIYVGGDHGWVFALNRTNGALKWSRQIETTPNSRVSSSPIVVGNIVIIGSGSYQVFVPATPIFRGRVAFLDATTGAVLNYNVNVCPTGTCGGGISVWSTAAVDTTTRTGYIGTGQAYAAPAGPYSDALVAFNIDTGAIKWSYQFTPNDVYTINTGTLDHDVGAAPNLFTATVNGVSRQLVGVGDKGGRYAAFDRVTGERIWITTIGNASPIGGMMHSAAYNNGRIYVVNNSANVGGTRNDPVPRPAAASALDAATGTVLWTRALTEGGFGGVSIANGLMYFTTWNGVLNVLNASTGAIVKTVQVAPSLGAYVPVPTDGFPNGSASGPVVYQGSVYVGYGWTWVLNIDGGLTKITPRAAPSQLAGTCPGTYVAQSGTNINFVSDGVSRAFVLNLPSASTPLPGQTAAPPAGTPRPVWVALTGSVESTNENLTTRGGNAAMTSEGYIVIGPVRACSGQDPNGGGTSVNGGTCNQAGTGGWNWNPWNEGRTFDTTGNQWKTNEGNDSRFLENIVRCVAKTNPVDANRIFVGGISSGGTMTNRALLFNSDFWAGGEPISGEWYITRSDGTTYATASQPDDFTARRAAATTAFNSNEATIFQGRVGPYPLYNTNGNTTQISPMLVITLWGGVNDLWSCPPLCSDYRPTTQASSNYFSVQPNVVHVSCSANHGHQWPTYERDAWNRWVLRTLYNHPKGTAKSAFTLPALSVNVSGTVHDISRAIDPTNGYSCVVGNYTDHYPF